MKSACAPYKAKPTQLLLVAIAAICLLAVTPVIAKRGDGGGGSGAPTCSISVPQNDPVAVTTGGSELFQGVVSGGTPPYSVTWSFDGGSPGSANETLNNSGDQTQQYNVSYAASGTYTATLAATDSGKRAKSCEASRTVDVSDGTGNSRPVAQNDDYNTTEGVELLVPAPGVLGNDNDPDGDPISAILVSNVSNGILNLDADGGFSYTPDTGFTGSDTFSYTANDSGGASNIALVTIGVAANNAISINSTSTDGTLPLGPVPELGPVLDANYALVAINDLGMHCGDLDTRISSILPPFNVLHAQVVQRGVTGLPQLLGEGQAKLYYSAASNPNDPAIAKTTSGQALSSVVNNRVYKTNFWDIASQAYAPFYPPGILDAFYDANTPANNVDIGLPVPDVERLYLGDGQLHATQQAMPGLNAPYVLNDPQLFEEHFDDLPFFTNPAFQFGYVADGVNWFEAAGVPIAAFDDFGRENPYPLMKVEAHVGGVPVATLDTVMPISGEAECQACHSADIGDGAAIANLTDVAMAADDPRFDDGGTPKPVPFEVSVEWASDINILRLHDQKHQTSLAGSFDPNTGRADNPVVCQTCHYTPALDLAQVGPKGPADPDANGRQQTDKPTMSNVMHSHHATVTNAAGESLFPDMPPAIDAAGNRRDPLTTQTILEQTCYSCHPGKRTQCMRGAMANGGLVCQDCHGQMAQVGDDFSKEFSLDQDVNGDGQIGFILEPDFYTNPHTPRVPWANEPGCGSCHTGYATDNLAGEQNQDGTPSVLVNPTDTLGNTDGIRLLAAYRVQQVAGETSQDPHTFVPQGKAAPIVPTNKAFAENTVAQGLPADGNPKLYRVSTGHGGVMCEGCHGSTHAEWPTANPNANDNVAANQLQGHSGYIAECQVCHEPTDASLPLGNNGPHGMHPVADLEPNLGVNGANNGTDFIADNRWNLQHKNYRNDGPGCQSCHGDDLKGTVLSRTADERTVTCKDTSGSLPGCAAGNQTAIIPKGTPVSCGMCHRQKR